MLFILFQLIFFMNNIKFGLQKKILLANFYLSIIYENKYLAKKLKNVYFQIEYLHKALHFKRK